MKKESFQIYDRQSRLFLTILQRSLLGVWKCTSDSLDKSVGSDQGGIKKCISFVSEYTDCTDENQCSGCSKCTCNAQGEWSCQTVDRCTSIMERVPLNDDDIDSALLIIENEMKKDKKAAATSKDPLVPSPQTAQDLIIVPDHDDRKFSMEDELMDLMRYKRSIDKHALDGSNRTVRFHNTVDEINEDTLKNVNLSGTIQANKLDPNHQKLSRRTGVLHNKNSSNSLQIEYNKPNSYQNIHDKVDTVVTAENKYDSLNKSTNFTQEQKDKDLSKLIVTELKGGIEVIGDKNAPIMSNVTFTPENDTLAAMTYIAGNLLNKLWNMNRDSSESIEIEVLKHEKIADLLEIFKNPLTMRQESFLKNALEQLSTAIDKKKDIKSISLCDSVKEMKKLNKINNKENDKSALDRDKPKSSKVEALTKMNGVVDLVKKFENVKKRVDALKEKPKERKFQFEKITSNGKKDNSLNLFADILEKITKLIVPDRRSKNMIKNLKNHNIFNNKNSIEKKFKEIFKTGVDNLPITAKDKIILDYLQRVDSNPDCLLNQKADSFITKPKPSIEGDILLNLSEFFKIKSLNDLVELLSTANNDTKDLSDTRILKYQKKKLNDIIPEKTTTGRIKNQTFLEAKEKLKAHLNTVLEDIIEIQVGKGMPDGKRNIEITDILPCIYNILNSNHETKPHKVGKLNSIEKVAAVFKKLKKDLKYTQNTRRANSVSERPKSAVIWDRVIKNLNEKRKLSTRRSMEVTNKVKSYDEIKKIIEQTESGSNTYKSVALLNEVPAADRLTLLKTFDMDVKKYIDALEIIKVSLEAGRIPSNKFNEVTEYIENVKNNINLNERVVKNVTKRKLRRLFVENIDSRKGILLKNKVKSKQSIKSGEEAPAYYANTKITRDQIINQLIKNRLRLFMRVKEASNSNISEDISYDIAKKILIYLERGNLQIARDLYKVFVSQYETNLIKSGTIGSSKRNENERNVSMRDKEPFIHFDEEKVDDVPLIGHEHLLKQLINIKNMNM